MYLHTQIHVMEEEALAVVHHLPVVISWLNCLEQNYISQHRSCYLLLQSSELNSLEKVLESEPARKRSILKYMKDALLPLVDK